MMNLSFGPPASAHEATAEMAHAANQFLAALTPEQRKKAQFDFADDERKKWHYVPMARKGIPFKELDPSQRLLAHTLLSSGLSHQGYAKATTIMSLESVLAEIEQGKGPVRDADLYYVTIFGTPNDGKPGNAPWGWRFEGHHLSVNFTTAQSATALTPSFFGSNPGEVKSGPRTGTRPLASEENLGRELVKSLDEKQRAIAVIMQKAPADILNVPGRNDRTKAEGLSHAQMAKAQKALLMRLIQEYIGRHRAELAQEDWAKLEKAGRDKIHFAWAGGFEPGQPHYYRVQGETFVLEYDNTQNNANHVHSVWRDFDHDFGLDLLKAHYEHGHHAKSDTPKTP